MLGTGLAGRTLAGALAGRGHDVVVGTRDVDVTSARPDVAEWQGAHPGIRRCLWARRPRTPRFS